MHKYAGDNGLMFAVFPSEHADLKRTERVLESLQTRWVGQFRKDGCETGAGVVPMHRGQSILRL
jgi:hypothetical protein